MVPVAEIGLLMIALLALIAPALMIWALVDLLQRPTAQWQGSGDSKLMWLLLIIFVALVGPVLYLTIGRRQLERLGPMGPQPG